MKWVNIWAFIDFLKRRSVRVLENLYKNIGLAVICEDGDVVGFELEGFQWLKS